MVHSQNRSRCGFGGVTAVGIDVENVHAVVVITHTLIPIVSFQTLVGILRHVAGQAIASGVQHFDAIACRHNHLVQNAFGNRIEAQEIRARQFCNGGGGGTAAARQHWQCKHRGKAHATAQHVAT